MMVVRGDMAIWYYGADGRADMVLVLVVGGRGADDNIW